MKQLYTPFLLCLVLLCLLAGSAPAVAQQRRTTTTSSSNNKYAKNKLDLHQIHNISMWGGLGYSGMVNNHGLVVPNMNPEGTAAFQGGAGGLIGVGYEWHYKKFMLMVGPELRFFSSKDKINFNAPASIAGTDPSSAYVLPGETKYYDLHKFSQNNSIGQIMLPIMVGGNWEKEDIPMYFLAGAKIGYTLFSSYTQKGELTTYLSDEWAYNPEWRNIRDLGTADYAAKGKSNFGLDVTLSAEVGLWLDNFMPAEFQDKNEDRRFPWHMRVGLFLDYGLPIQQIGNPDKSTGMRDVSEANLSTTSLFDNYAASKANSLLVGAKFTALLQMNRPKLPKPKNPYLVVQVINGRTGKPESAEVAVTSMINNRVQKKSVNSKGFMVQRFKPAEYKLSVTKAGFLPVEDQMALLIENEKTDLKQKLDTNVFVLWPIPVFTCSVRDSKSGELIAATVSIVENHENANTTIAELKQDIAKGSVSYKLPLGQDYSALITAENYQQQIYPIGVQQLEDIVKSFTLDPIIKGRTYVIENLFFASNETRILPQSEQALQELYEYLNDNPDIRIRITGHTDWVGTDEANQILSEGRAESVKQSMVERGIDANRMETEGKGESQPVDTNETEEGRQHNRRVEFTVL